MNYLPGGSQLNTCRPSSEGRDGGSSPRPSPFQSRSSKLSEETRNTKASDYCSMVYSNLCSTNR